MLKWTGVSSRKKLILTSLSYSRYSRSKWLWCVELRKLWWVLQEKKIKSLILEPSKTTSVSKIFRLSSKPDWWGRLHSWWYWQLSLVWVRKGLYDMLVRRTWNRFKPHQWVQRSNHIHRTLHYQWVPTWLLPRLRFRQGCRISSKFRSVGIQKFSGSNHHRQHCSVLRACRTENELGRW